MGGITLEDMTAAGALLEGHFKLSSGLHSSRYLQCALYLADPARAEAAGRQLAARLKTVGAQLVMAPALGGVIIGHEVARALEDVPFFFTERAAVAPPDSRFQIRRLQASSQETCRTVQVQSGLQMAIPLQSGLQFVL